MNKQFDVIIVNYNSRRNTEANIASLMASGFKDRLNIMVQDNNSDEDILPLIHKFPQINLVRNKKNIGFAAASNQAIQKGMAPYVVLLNPDAYVAQGVFKKLLAYLQENDAIGILGPKILNFDGSIQGSARSFPNPLTSLFGRSSFLTRCFPNNPVSRANMVNLSGMPDQCMEVDWVSGACMVIRRSALAQTGNLDQRFFMYWEDADLCRRMWQAGWKVVYFPEATVYHQVGQSSRTSPYQSIIHFHKSSYLLLKKYSSENYRFLDPLVLAALVVRAFGVALVAGIKTLVRAN